MFSVAPMMDWTDRHCRSFHRVLTKGALLYTEMVTTGAVLHGDRERLLGFSAAEHPVALQLGGSDPADLARATAIGVDYGYDEINLNCGCPSDRVQKGAFGACLMREETLVAECLSAMREAAKGRPVTVKHRLGVDDDAPEERAFRFVETLAKAGTTRFIVHARNAWLKGLSPKENRDVPPLRYEVVYALKRAFPDVTIVLNGGIADLATARAAIAEGLDGVMVGRAAYQTPALLLEVDPVFYGAPAPAPDMTTAIERFMPYIADRLSEGVPLHAIARHMLGAFHGRPGGRLWRRVLSEEGCKPGAGLDVMRKALSMITESSRRVVV